MANSSDIYSVLVPATAPVFTAHTYSEIYGGGAGCTVNVNGVDLSMAAGSTLNLWIRSISGGTGCFLLGENNDFYMNYQPVNGTQNIIGGINV